MLAPEEQVRFCVRCGAPLTRRLRFGRVRPVCPTCGWVFFPDPKVAVAVLVEQEGQVLLVRRKYPPAAGRWTLPAGFMDAGEHPEDAAVRECAEETGLAVRILGLFTVFGGRAHPQGADVLLVYRAEVVGGALHPGDDADQAAFFAPHALPPLAFETTARILTAYFNGLEAPQPGPAG